MKGSVPATREAITYMSADPAPHHGRTRAHALRLPVPRRDHARALASCTKIVQKRGVHFQVALSPIPLLR